MSLVAGAVAGLLSPAAIAAQPQPSPSAPTWSWSGAYYGLHLGAGGADTAWTQATGPFAGVSSFAGSAMGGGLIGGGQIGYNHQLGGIVLGVEAEASFADLNGLAGCGTSYLSCATRIDFLATAAARVGYARDNLLLYGKAGAAVAHDQREMRSIAPSPAFDSGTFTGSDTRTGWMVGAGAEYAFNAALSAKVEYDYLDFGSKAQAMADQSGNVWSVTTRQDLHLVKLGLNYRLGADASAAAGMSAPALAGVDLPQWSWTGFYIGAHSGTAFGRNAWTSATGPLRDASSAGGFPGQGDSAGLLFGGQAGYNHQFGAWVAGVEVAASWSQIDGYAKCATTVGTTAASSPEDSNFSCHNSITSLGALTGRLGQSFGNLLIYGKAGAAWSTQASDAQSYSFVEQSGVSVDKSRIFRESATRWGWTAGAGLEYAFSPNLSAFVEYDHFDFGTRQASFTDPSGNTSLVGFAQRLDLVKTGLNYRLGAGAPAFGADLSGPRAVAPVLPASQWSLQVGTRYWGSSGRMQKDLYADETTPNKLASRLIYGGQTGQALETFVRFDHASGLFAKGTLGVGHLLDGTLYDEDFPGGAVYSDTRSEMKNGRMTFGSLDLGYDVINAAGGKLGAFVGYRSFDQTSTGFGCVQLALDEFCNSGTSRPIGVNQVGSQGLSETQSWRGAAVGMNAQAQLSDRIRLEVDAAYLPYVDFSGLDNHWLRAAINPLAESGHGWGTQTEAILSYALTDRFSIGVGGRYWFFTTSAAKVRFPGELSQALTFYTERYGGFLQASYKFGDLDHTARAGSAAPQPAAPATNWSGLYVGASVGSGWGRSRWNDPFPAPVAGDAADLGGALAGGQIGANMQRGSWVAGVEVAGSWANILGTDTCFAGYPNPAVAGMNCGTRIGAIGTATARAGYAVDHTLLYVKGGAAWARLTHELNAEGLPGGVISSSSGTSLGWTAGGGIEYALPANWSVALEYKYVDLGATTASLAVPAPFYEPVATTAQLVTLGINYRFAPQVLRAGD